MKYKLIVSLIVFVVCMLLMIVSFQICDDILKYHGDTHCTDGEASLASMIFIFSLLGCITTFLAIFVLMVMKAVRIFMSSKGKL